MKDKIDLVGKGENEDKLQNSEVSMDAGGQSNAENADKGRRTALLSAIGVAGAASLPSEWKKPVIDSLVLPAHAQMSPSQMTQTTVTEVIAQRVVTISAGTVTCVRPFTRIPSYVVSSANNSVSTSYYDVTFGDGGTYQTLCSDGAGGTTLSSSSGLDQFSRTYSATVDFSTFPTLPASYSTYCGASTGFTDVSSYTATETALVTTTTTVTV